MELESLERLKRDNEEKGIQQAIGYRWPPDSQPAQEARIMLMGFRPFSLLTLILAAWFSTTFLKADIADGTNRMPHEASVLSQRSSTTAPLGEERLDPFERRREAILNAFSKGGRDHFQNAECLFSVGKTQDALIEVNKGLDTLVPGNNQNRWMHGGNTGFISWPGIDCFLRFEKFLDPATKERYRKIYTGGVFYARLSTSNHKLMAAVTRYLAAQVWGPDSFHADPFFMQKDPYIQLMTSKINNPGQVWGTSFAPPGDPTGEKYLNQIIDATVKGGPGEFASRPYGAQNILPLLTLADCAKDQVMARKARMAYEMCLLQLAPAWLRGHLATFAPRSYPDTECQRPWGMAVLPWMYFGGVTPRLENAKAAVQPAVSTYRTPEIIVNAATDRKEPYFYKALINGFALNHYVNKTYALFSRSAKVGGRPWQGQSYPCGVMWEQDPEKGSHLWITAPSEDLPGQMGNHTHGVRSYEQEILGRDALLFVFQIPPGSDFPYGLGYIPGGYLAFTNDSKTSGHIFLHYGSVLIAVSTTQPFDWNPAGRILAPASQPRAGDSEFRIKRPSFAVAIETAQPSEFKGSTPAEQLSEFRETILSKSVLNLNSEQPAAARYENRFGDSLGCVFDGTDTVNGTIIDYKAWPVSESPWTSQKTPESSMLVSNGKALRTYNFLDWTVTDSIK